MSRGAQQASARVAAKNAVKIRAALKASVDGRRVYAQYMETNPPVTKDRVLDRARARAWAMNNVSLDLSIYRKVLAKHYADMYVLGQSEAAESMANRAQKGPVATISNKPKLNPKGQVIFDPSFSINWDNWEPGNAAAAALISKPGGLKQLLDKADVQSEGIAKYGYDLIGTTVADGIANGDTPTQIGNAIADVISSPERALTIAITEGQRAKIEAQVDAYAANGVEQIEWTTNDPCPDCEQNDGEIVNMGDEFPSGDIQPPAHPNCQCTVIPTMPDLSGTPNYADLTDEEVAARLEMGAEADLGKYSPDQERDERGRFGPGGGATGGSGLSRAEMHLLNARRDPLVDKIYSAEKAAREGQQIIRGNLEKPVAPTYPKEAVAQAIAEGNMAERLRLSAEYNKQYDEYSKAFGKYQKDYKVVSLQSDLAKNTLDGTKAGVVAYINNVITQSWFVSAYGDGSAMGKLGIGTADVKSYAGRYTSGLTKNEIKINNPYTQNEPTLIHEISHYAQAISATSTYEAHGVGFAETNVHITENIMGTAAAERLANAYAEKGVKITNG